MSTLHQKKEMEKKNVDRYVGPSLYNNKWSNTKWTSTQIYFGGDQSQTVTTAGKNRGSKQKKSIDHQPTSNENTSNLLRPGKKAINRYPSDQNGKLIDRSNLVEQPSIDVVKDDQSPVDQSISPSVSQRKRRHRHKKSIQYKNYDASNNNSTGSVWLPCQYCQRDYCCCYYYSHCQCQMDESRSISISGGDGSRRNSLIEMSPYGYYYFAEATYAFNTNFSTNYGHANIVMPPERIWISMSDFDEQQQPAEALATITTMSYNILSDKYVSSTMYAFSPTWSLNWDYRKRLIMQQLKKYRPDVIALQEVETLHYWTYFKLKLEALGYSSTFSAKSRARTMREDERQSVDGCALFWKAEKFELHQEHVIEFTQLAIAKAEGSEHMLNRVMTRDNIALAAVLQIRQGLADEKKEMNGEFGNGQSPYMDDLIGTPLIVCSTHIHWDPEYCDVKLVQSMMLLQELNRILDQTSQEYDLLSDRIPVLVCGDLNSTEDSSVYDFLTNGYIEANHVDFKDFRGQTCLQKLSSCSDDNLSDVYSHNLQLKSAYDIGTMPFTNYTYDFKGVIDYIFASPNLVRQAVLGPLDSDWFREQKILACPCPFIPSDHIPLLAQYAIVLPSIRDDQTSISDSPFYDTDD